MWCRCIADSDITVIVVCKYIADISEYFILLAHRSSVDMKTAYTPLGMVMKTNYICRIIQCDSL